MLLQIRSHAQKHFLKAHKFGLAAALPPPHPRRAALLHPPPTHPNNGAADTMPPPWTGGTLPISSIGCMAPSGVQHSMDWGCTPPESCWPNLDSQGHVHNPITPLFFPSKHIFCDIIIHHKPFHLIISSLLSHIIAMHGDH